MSWISLRGRGLAIARVRLRGFAGARIARGLLPAAMVGVGATVALGLGIKAGPGGLGTPLPPFLMSWRPALHPLVLVSLAVLVAAVLLTPTLVDRGRPAAGYAVALYGLALALGLSVNLARAGTGGWWTVFATGRHGSFEGGFEYLPSLPALAHGASYYLDHFDSLIPYVTTHVKGNPPGPLIALHLLGIGTPAVLAALCIGIGALCAPLAYDLGRTLGGEQRGRLAGVLTAFSPAMLLFGVTSADFAFAALGLCGACLLARRGSRALVAGSLVVAIASFFSWLLLAIGGWAAVLALARDGWQRAVAVCVAVGLAVVAFNGLLALGYGYDPLAALRATAHAYHHGVAATRPYAFWVVGSPAAWALVLGLPITWLALRALGRADPAAVAVCVLVLVASLLGFTKAETERIWLPFVPLACVAAAAAPSARRVRLRPLLGLLGAQALVTEVLFFTVW